MDETILKAAIRTEEPKKIRKAGFTPGALNGPGTTSVSVQFESPALNKIIARHGPNAKLWVELDKKKHFGFIKEVQRHPVEGKVLHVSILLVSKDQEIKMHLPIVFHGREELEHKILQVNVYKSDIEVSGKASHLPDSVVLDVGKKELGDSITAADFNLPKELKVLDAENEIYAVIKAIKEEVVEEVVAEEAEPAEAEAEVAKTGETKPAKKSE